MKTHSSTLRVLQILEYLGYNNKAKLEDITKATKIPYTTAYRILQTCLKNQFLEFTKEKYYKLTSKLFQIVSSHIQLHTSLIGKAQPYLQELSYKTKETVHLTILSGNKVLYIDKIDSHHVLRMYSRIGNEVDVYCTAVGKVLLTWLSQPVQNALIKTLKFTHYTKNTITDKKLLVNHLKQIYKQGYAEDKEEHELHIYCLAVPVFDKYNNVIAAISVSSLTLRITDFYKKLAIKNLKECGKNVSKILGNKDYKQCLENKF